MNKKILKAAFIAAIAMVSGVNVFNAQKTNVLSDITLANVEALAQGEVDFPFYCAGTGYCAIDGIAYDGTKYSWQ